MPIYKVCQCPSCGAVQLSTAQKSMKCVRCGKSRGFGTKLGVPVIREFTDFRQAHVFILEYKRQTKF